MHPTPPPQLQFELADADKGSADPKRARRLLTKARDVRASLSTLAYEVKWAGLLRTSTDATRRMGWQLLSYSRPQVRSQANQGLVRITLASLPCSTTYCTARRLGLTEP